MDKNLNLNIGFKGQLKLNAQAVPMQEGYLKIGGIAAENLAFGIAVSADPDTLDSIEAGIDSGNVLRGICVFDDAIAQNSPAHPGEYLEGMPCAFLNHGFMWMPAWTKTASGAADPTIGCKVIAKNADGTIEFIGSATDVPANWTQITNASVRALDAEHGALIYLN